MSIGSLAALLLAHSGLANPALAHPGEDILIADAQQKKVTRRRPAQTNQRRQTNNRRNANQRNGRKKKKGPKLVGPFKKDKYPRQERFRPLVLPHNMAEFGVAGGYETQGGENGAFLNPSIDYGIGNRVEVGLSSGVDFIPVGWSQNINLRGRFLAIDGKRFDFAPGVNALVSFGGDENTSLTLDLLSRHVTRGVAFFYFGQDAIPIEFGDQVSASLVGNAGLGLQLSKGTAFMIDAALITLNVVPETAVTGPWETLTANARLQYSPGRKVDIGAKFTVENQWQGDAGPALGATAFAALRF